MATRSVIVDKVSNRGIYCHWDGYPSHNGVLLAEHYADQDKVDALINLGDISRLGVNIDDGDTESANGISQHTSAYHRDTGEEWDRVKPATNVFPLIKQFANRAGAEYIYTWDGSKWTWKLV